MKAYISVELPSQFHKYFPKDRGGDDASPPHITVLYVGEINPKHAKDIRKIAQACAKDTPPAKCKFGSLGNFPAGEYGVPWYVEVIEDGNLTTLHKKIWAALKSKGIPVEHRHPEYHPHATLRYLPKGEEYTGDLPTGQFTISELTIDITGEDNEKEESKET